VLSATPAWSSVSQSLRRLKRLREDTRHAEYPEMESDFSAVWEFSQMLQGSGIAVAEALISAKVLGQFQAYFGPGPITPEQRILQGLSTLSFGLLLRGLSIVETREKIRRFTIELKAQYSWLTLDEADFYFSPGRVNQWLAALNKVLETPEISTLSADTAKSFTEKVERAWHERFAQFFKDGTTIFEPIAGDLICSAAWLGLSRLMYLDLKQVTIANWTELVLRSFTEGASLFQETWTASYSFGMAALFQLGFGAQASDVVNSGQTSQFRAPASVPTQQQQEAIEEIDRWVQSSFTLQVSTVKQGVIVVLDSSEPTVSLAWDWMPSSKYAAFAVRTDQLFELKQALQPIWTNTLIARVIVELSSSTLQNWNSAPISQLSTFPELLSVPYSYFSRSAPPGLPPTSAPLTVSPKSLDAAIDLASPVSGASSNLPLA
jgi:hypothetical protein